LNDREKRMQLLPKKSGDWDEGGGKGVTGLKSEKTVALSERGYEKKPMQGEGRDHNVLQPVRGNGGDVEITLTSLVKMNGGGRKRRGSLNQKVVVQRRGEAPEKRKKRASRQPCRGGRGNNLALFRAASTISREGIKREIGVSEYPLRRHSRSLTTRGSYGGLPHKNLPNSEISARHKMIFILERRVTSTPSPRKERGNGTTD